MESEEWKDIVGYEGKYLISSFGRIKSLSRMVGQGQGRRRLPDRVLKPTDNGDGYLNVSLCDLLTGKAKTHSVHRLVARHFLALSDKPDVNHKDSMRSNCRAGNLEYVTKQGNTDHAKAAGSFSPFQNPNMVQKLTQESVEAVRKRLALGHRQVDIAKDFSVSQSTISLVSLNKIWSLPSKQGSSDATLVS